MGRVRNYQYGIQFLRTSVFNAKRIFVFAKTSFDRRYDKKESSSRHINEAGKLIFMCIFRGGYLHYSACDSLY